MSTRRHRLKPGEAGDPWLVDITDPESDKVVGYQARVRVRDRDGRIRQVSAKGATKGAARRALADRLARRTNRASVGVSRGMTVTDLGEYWLSRRERQSATPGADQRRGGPVSPQSLAAYRAAFTSLIIPALGELQLAEVTVGIVDEAIADIEERGRSTAQARTVLKQMFALAVRHGGLDANPMNDVARPPQRAKQVNALTVTQAQHLLAHLRAYCGGHAVDKQGRRTGGKPRNSDLYDLVLLLLATGARIGEALAIRWRDVFVVHERQAVHLCGTLVEPKKGYVEKLHRQPATKGREDRTLILPDAAVGMLAQRKKRTPWRRLDDPVFASAGGTWLWPNNQRTRLRLAVAGTEFAGLEPHTLRRTVGTLLTHEAGVDTARDVLGHSDPTVTFQHYTAQREIAPDVRHLLDRFFAADAGKRAEDEPGDATGATALVE